VVELSTVKVKLPCGASERPLTVALTPRLWPQTGEDGVNAPSAMVAVGGAAGPVVHEQHTFYIGQHGALSRHFASNQPGRVSRGSVFPLALVLFPGNK